MFAFKSSELRGSNPPSSTLIFHRKSKRMNVNQRQERIRKAHRTWISRSKATMSNGSWSALLMIVKSSYSG